MGGLSPRRGLSFFPPPEDGGDLGKAATSPPSPEKFVAHVRYGPRDTSIALADLADVFAIPFATRIPRENDTRLGRPPLKNLTGAQMQLLRRERRKARRNFKGLAEKYVVSIWTAFQQCKRAARER